MKTSRLRLFLQLAFLIFVGTFQSQANAEVMPWTYTGTGTGTGSRAFYGYSGGWSTSYRYVNTSPIYYSSGTPVTSYYSPGIYNSATYYGGGNISAGCGCNPCGYSPCQSCSGSGCLSGNCATGNCPTGDCSTNGVNYSPEPTESRSNDNAPIANEEVTPTFKPTQPEKKEEPDLNDDFRPLERREKDFVAPRTNSTVPNRPNSSIPESSIPSNANTSQPNTDSSIPAVPNSSEDVLPNLGNPGSSPMSPPNRPKAPEANPNSGLTPINTPNSSEEVTPSGFPGRTDAPKFPSSTTPRPAPIEPGGDEAKPVFPGMGAKPLELKSHPQEPVVVQRNRVVMKAGYRIPAVSRIEIPAQTIIEAGSSKLAVR